MKLSDELIQQAKKCKSADEVETLAKQNNIELAKGEAREIFRVLNASGELSDDELGNVAGGASYSGANCSDDEPHYAVGYATKYLRPDGLFDTGVFGTVQKVSDTKQGLIFKEYVYTMLGVDGQTDEVYEEAIDYFHPTIPGLEGLD